MADGGCAGEDAAAFSDPLIGHSPGMEELFKGIGRAAARDMSVLLVGERGTGKALVARAIYQNSSRATTPYRISHRGDSFILSHYTLVQFFFQVQQFLAFALHHTLYRYTGCFSYIFCNVVSIYFFFQQSFLRRTHLVQLLR